MMTARVAAQTLSLFLGISLVGILTIPARQAAPGQSLPWLIPGTTPAVAGQAKAQTCTATAWNSCGNSGFYSYGIPQSADFQVVFRGFQRSEDAAHTFSNQDVSGASLTRYFPILQSDASEFVGLSLVNTSFLTNEASIIWTSSDGTRNLAGRISLAPGAQRAALIREFLGVLEDPKEGWIQIESALPGLLSYLTSGREGVLDGTEPASQVGTSILLPQIDVNTGFAELEYKDTVVLLVNPGMVTASARMQLIGLDGNTLANLPVSIPAGACRSMRVSESFREMLPVGHYGGRTFQGYMMVLSDAGLAAWLQIDTPLSLRLFRGRTAEEIVPSRTAMVAHFAFDSAGHYNSALNIINAGSSKVALELIAEDDRGKKIGDNIRIALGPGQGLRDEVGNLFRIVVPAIYPPPMITGYIRIRAVDGSMIQIAGNIDINTSGNIAAMLYPLTTAPSSDWTMPFVVSGTDYFTGYAIANVNELLTVQTDVTVEILDEDGRLVGFPQKISLSPAARFVGMVSDNLRSGYLHIRANFPVAVLGCIGARDGSTLASLPAFPLK